MLFRQDLRMTDNPALTEAVKQRAPLICLFVWDPNRSGLERPGQAGQWWLHHSLHQLQKTLLTIGNDLLIRTGCLNTLIPQIVRQYDITRIFWNQSYEPTPMKEEKNLVEWGREEGLRMFPSHGNLLTDPETFRNQSGKPYVVFTPFWNHLKKTFTPTHTHSAPRHLPSFPAGAISDQPCSSRSFLSNPARAQEWGKMWEPGEAGAKSRLNRFLQHTVGQYQTGRDRPDKSHTSRLSPHLHFGELSPRYVWKRVSAVAAKSNKEKRASLLAFQRQLAWREFAQHLLFHFPQLPHEPLRSAYTEFPWKQNQTWLGAWQKGQTGYPIVDAGMRELWQTGWMHNRVRMIVASFLTKHLLQPWQDGAAWFWDTLLDADLGNNTLGWQWVAGCGADAAPFFRIFNPMIQGKKFDPDGRYVRQWIPELSKLPNQYVHEPWNASKAQLEEANVTLGKTYPHPIIDHRIAREDALHAFKDFTEQSPKPRSAIGRVKG